jgi:hypothetical protein
VLIIKLLLRFDKPSDKPYYPFSFNKEVMNIGSFKRGGQKKLFKKFRKPKFGLKRVKNTLLNSM